MAQCLQTMKNKHKHDIDLRGAPNGAKAFAFISPNFLEEEGASTEGDGIGESPAFSERGLMNLLDSSIHQLAKANLYEIINDVYKLLIPMHEKSKDWTLLSADHFTLHKHLTELVKLVTGCIYFFTFYLFVLFFIRTSRANASWARTFALPSLASSLARSPAKSTFTRRRRSRAWPTSRCAWSSTTLKSSSPRTLS